MLAREKWELAAIEEQRRAQDKERAKVEFRYMFKVVLLILHTEIFLQLCNEM